jgi:hypothetical protein
MASRAQNHRESVQDQFTLNCRQRALCDLTIGKILQIQLLNATERQPGKPSN